MVQIQRDAVVSTKALEEASARYALPKDRELFATKTITLDGGDIAAKTEDIRHYFHKTFEVYELLFKCLASDEAFTIKPVHGLRHPMIFYLGHTATFYVNKLVLAGLTTRINPKFEEMFAVGVDEMSWDDLNDSHYDWPAVSEVWEYRRMVRDRIDSIFKERKFRLVLPVTFENSTSDDDHAFFWVMAMGAEHERIHLETASVHVRELPLRLVKKQPYWSRHCTEYGQAPENELVPFEGGDVVLGRPAAHQVYGWDCDYGVQKVTVAAFQASKYLVTNAAFLDFMRDGGYGRNELWDEEGWSWVSWRHPTHPWFWVAKATNNSNPNAATLSDFRLRLQLEEVELPADWPCELNHLEAKAYCRWLGQREGKSLRLPTEAEWEVMHRRCVSEDQFQWKVAPGNINLEFFTSSCPVTKFRQGPLYDVVGNVWQHTETPMYPYPGYRVHPYYDDFSMPTFDGRHFCMKGGAWISTGNVATHHARYAFRRHFFQFIGVRYVEGPPVNESVYLKNVLGMDPEVDAAAALGFETDPLATLSSANEPSRPALNDNFGRRLADLAWQRFSAFRGVGRSPLRAMELLCGAGRTSFELTRHFMEVTGVDFTARQLQTAFSIRERGNATYSILDAFGKRSARTIDATQFDFNASRERAFFYQADPSNLHVHLNDFDLIVAWRVLERHYNPRAILPHLLGRLNKGGILIVASDYAWSDRYAAEEAWLRPSNAGATPREELLRLVAGLAEEIAPPATLPAAVATTPNTLSVSLYEVITLRKL